MGLEFRVSFHLHHGRRRSCQRCYTSGAPGRRNPKAKGHGRRTFRILLIAEIPEILAFIRVVSSNPGDYFYLTAGGFVTGKQVRSAPERKPITWKFGLAHVFRA